MNVSYLLEWLEITSTDIRRFRDQGGVDRRFQLKALYAGV